ncbi:hypothetical protein C8Q75DRAFT_306320 [Abortiporus biennis]|nr:hypothetical protein C8Q75DRAFT_306320 [Abortiporus biennis]
MHAAKRLLQRTTRTHFIRQASTSANPYPFPPNSNPTPHQIFHLPKSASLKDVKTRYYDLVRIYHPDSPVSRAVLPATAQARFQAISAAYDVLRGKSRILPSGETEPVSKDTTTYHELSTAMWRAKQRRRADLSVGGVDERWKERMMMATIFFSIAAFVLQAYTTRREAIQASLEKASEARHRHYNDSYILNARQPKPSLSAEDSALAAEGPHNPKPSS